MMSFMDVGAARKVTLNERNLPMVLERSSTLPISTSTSSNEILVFWWSFVTCSENIVLRRV